MILCIGIDDAAIRKNNLVVKHQTKALVDVEISITSKFLTPSAPRPCELEKIP